jgi:hypothetical protein
MSPACSSVRNAKSRDRTDAGKMLERGDNDLLRNAHPALERLRSLNLQADCEPRRSTEPQGLLRLADAECRDCQKLPAWHRSD